MADEALSSELILPSLPAPVAGQLVASPYSFEFTAANQLRLSVANSLTGCRVDVHYRIAQPDGTIVNTSNSFIPTSDRTITTMEWTIGQGYLLNVTCFASSGTPKRGQTFVKLQVIHGGGGSATVLGTLVQGYVTANQDLAWPGSPIETSTDGDGYFHTITGTAPGAGNEVSEQVPTGAWWEFFSFRTNLLCSAAAATRRSGLTVTNLGAVFYRSPQPGTVTAGLQVDNYWAQGSPFLAAILTDVSIAVLPTGLRLPAGARLTTNTNNLQAGDTYSAPLYAVREWLDV